ncbi:MAG: PQQ-binding-like beta-propeller repeat protein [Candidatus Doudnabacteria bacterium]
MKKVLTLLLCVGTGALAVFCITIIKPDLLGLSASTWFTFHGDVSRTGFSTSGSPANATVAWAYELKEKGNQKGVILGSPTVAENKVFFGALDGKVHALDLKTGKELWTFKGQKSFGKSSPTISANKVIIGGQDKFVYALNVQDGKQVWRHLTEGIINSSPVILGNQVFIGSEDGYLYALNVQTGKRDWREKLGDKISTSPAIYKNKIYVGVETNTENKFELFCLNPSNGNQYWSYETDANTKLTSVSAGNNLIYAGGTDGKIYAFRYSDGTLSWSKEGGDEFNDAPALAYNRIYALNGNGELTSMGSDNGNIFWRYKSGVASEASPIVADKKICFGNQSGNFYCVDRAGTLIWKKKLAGEITTPATVSPGMIIVVSHTDKNSTITAFGK